MTNPNINYKSLNEEGLFRNDNEVMNDSNIPMDQDDTPRNSGVMIHIVPENSKARWNHIDDLDSFFTRMYNYHQKHGFTVIILDEAFQLLEIGFVAWLLTFTVHCIKYSILFGKSREKVSLSDIMVPMGQCVTDFGGYTYLVLFVALLYFIMRLIKTIYHITQYLEIKKFYNLALHIEDNELDNITWHEVKQKVREVQAEQHMCIDKEQLTDLDIYHRILRFQNYMVALMNKNLLPVRFKLPIVGDFVTLSRGLLFNIDFILFRGPGSPFQNNWQLRDDYSVRSNQIELAQRLSNLIMWVAIANFLLSPIIFVWQLIYFSFSYVNILRKEPNALGARIWSNYGRLYLRHFNELEHELDARLNRAYDYGSRYQSSFSSPLIAVTAKNILFLSGGVLAIILALGIYDEYVFQVEHILTIITVLSAIGLLCRSLIPDENLIWCPEQLMTAILAHVHYLPAEWKNRAHTTSVRKEFENFFQFKGGYLLNEIGSPLITPFLLMFVFRPKALEIVKFFRSFTVTVKGVGNVCSFAQLDVRKHGNPEWQLVNSMADVSTTEALFDNNDKHFTVENGKTELSLIRFTLTNPEWQIPSDAYNFLKAFRESALHDLVKAKRNNGVTSNPITQSLLSFGTIGNEYSSIASSVFTAHNIPSASFGNSLHLSSKPVNENNIQNRQESGFEQMLQQNLGDPYHRNSCEGMRRMRVYKTEGCLEGPSDALLYSLYGLDPMLSRNITNVTVADMCLSTLYLHEIHKQNKNFKYKSNVGRQSEIDRSNIVTIAAETTPLLQNPHT